MKTQSYILFIILLGFCQVGIAQNKYFTRNGHISFFSKASLENIEAHNRQVSVVVDFTTHEMAFQVLIKSFEFRKALMQEHFNENYLESDKYPKATFKGKIQNPESINLNQDGKYKIQVSGTMTIHGISQNLTASGTVEVKSAQVRLIANFKLRPEDYKIKIPSVVRQNIAEVVDIDVNALCAKVVSGK
jgi:polyisoprenoid-binding protein YceI